MALKTFLLISICIITHLGSSQVGSPTYDPTTYINWEIEAEFPDGYENLLKYLEENKKKINNPRTQSEYTEDEKRANERVIVRFAIDTNGQITNAVLEVGLPQCEPCNQEALRLVENMPKWKPAQLLGKTINTLVRLPITFELENEKDDFVLLGCDLGIDPQFNGGEKALNKYIQKNMKLKGNPKWKKSPPKDELLEGGRLFVLFIIEADGQVSHVELEEQLPHCEPCNQEALRVIKNMPPWKPAYEKGKAVSTCIRLPINFVVD